jgi:hypothetical protein
MALPEIEKLAAATEPVRWLFSALKIVPNLPI